MSNEIVYVEHCKGVNGLDKVVLRESRRHSAEVYLYGGQVTSWKNEHGEELLFMSNKAMFKPPNAIRGGIPICFPQFGGLGTLEQHGFARKRMWTIDPDPPPLLTSSSNKAIVDLLLKHSEEDAKFWPHRYEIRLRVCLSPGGDLLLTTRVRNTNLDGKPFTFTFAYHSYFFVTDIRSPLCIRHLINNRNVMEHGESAVLLHLVLDMTLGSTDKLLHVLGFWLCLHYSLEKDFFFDWKEKDFIYWHFALQPFKKCSFCSLNNVSLLHHHSAVLFDFSEVRVEGLETLDYLDNLQNRERFTEQGDAIVFESEVDKVYINTPTKIAILDHERKRTYVIRKDGLPDAVVWNPWDKKSKAIPDLADDEYKHMLCVEAACVETPVTLKPGEEWKGRQEISAVPSSYCSGQLDQQT